MDSLKKLMLLLVLLLFPTLSFADADRIFKENRESIVVVTAYNKKGEPLTEGTGFIVGADGAVITNYHVIGIAKDIKVKAGGRVLNVEGVTYADKENDIVVLKVKGRYMPAVRLGDFGKVNPGGKVYVVSKSEDSGNIIHEGVFRRIRTIPPGRKVIEITAPVSHGSSGSPVFNEDGEVIGIVTFLLNRAEKLILAMPLSPIRDKIESRKIIASKEKLIKNYRESAEYWFYLGYFLSETGAYKEAIDVLKESIRLKPDFADAYYYLGTAYEKTEMYTKASDSYRKAVKAAPDFSDAYFSLGMTYGILGKYREAVDAFRDAVRIEPDYADAHYNLCLTYLLLKDKTSAVEQYKILKEISPGLANSLLRRM